MSSASAEGRTPDQSAQHHPPQQQPVGSPPLPPGELLAQILALSEETKPELAADLPEIKLLRDTARRHAGHPLQLQPIVTELLQVVLKPVRGMSADAHSRMLHQVAQTMWDDSESQRHLLELWASLQRSIAHDK
jgi:hypothetical protein